MGDDVSSHRAIPCRHIIEPFHRGRLPTGNSHVSRNREAQEEIPQLPDRPYTNGPEASFPSIESLRLPDGAPSLLVRLQIAMARR